MVRTDDAADLQWLQDVLLPSEPRFYKAVWPRGKLFWICLSLNTNTSNAKCVAGAGYSSHYRSLMPKRFYVKLDDDIMYIQDSAVDVMLHEKLKNQFWIVSANVINHGGTSFLPRCRLMSPCLESPGRCLMPAVLTWVHAAMGAMQLRKRELGGLDMGEEFQQRLLPFLQSDPFADIKYGTYEHVCQLSSLDCAALCHLNFLQHVASNSLSRYNFGVWDFNAFNYERWSINTILFKGSDLYREEMGNDDESHITELLSKAKRKRSGAVGPALVVHLAYHTQRNAGLESSTNFLELYAALASNATGPLLPP